MGFPHQKSTACLAAQLFLWRNLITGIWYLHISTRFDILRRCGVRVGRQPSRRPAETGQDGERATEVLLAPSELKRNGKERKGRPTT